ncbi:ATP-binding protein [Paraburkholderia bannensis]|uniref:ATP-binding protein n=1 Tax=Paraburkholderia bannensis TaxID=765414 RepID=UPI002AB6549A|nr:ATP-binding protein [Paraburkholderia bannensis]
MKRLYNTLFLRLAAMTVGLIVLLHVTFLLLVDRERATLEVLHISQVVMTAATVHEHDVALAPAIARELGIQYVPRDDASPALCGGSCSSRLSPIESALRERLPAGSRVWARKDGSISVDVSGTAYTIVVPKGILPPTRFLSASLLMLVFAVVSALIFAWQLQRPVQALARATREFRARSGFRDLTLSGPNEIRELTANFNEMASDLLESERERAIMLAGLAHDLRAPITRIQVRADLSSDAEDRAAFLRDTYSMSRIVDEFLDFSRGAVEPSPLESVDAICSREYGDVNKEVLDAGETTQELVRLDLQAGDGFRLPVLEVERIVINLVQNAMAYGAPPVEIATRKVRDGWLLQIRDHGQGVPQDDLASIQLPFVRLDPARGGKGSCGLGLAIVRRLVRRLDGSLSIANAPAGGLVVSMIFKARI